MATDVTDDAGREAGLELALMLMGKMSTDASFTTNALLDGYKTDYEKAQATIRAIRAQVEGLCSGPWMPSTAALMDALWPNAEAIEYHKGRPDVGPMIGVHAWDGGQYGTVD
jgi:hypothetical protein